jgi:tripartite-type tricarboxylate transporter receptor subunit TctC
MTARPFTQAYRAGAILIAGLALATAAASSQAQEFPQRPITLVVPFSAGSATDQLARAIAQSLTTDTKQAAVVENRGGAGGLIAAQNVARAPADGYTLLITTNTTHAAAEHLYKKLPYDPVKDFAPLTALGTGSQVMVVNADSPYKTVQDVIAAARKSPGKLTFGSGSSSSRVAGELFKQMTRTDIVHVPYKSNPLALNDLLGGTIDLMITDMSTGVPQIKGGKLRGLGVSTTQRSPMLPDLPTIAEAGVPGYDMGYWFAAYAPAGTPAPVVARLHDLLVNAVKTPAAVAFFQNSGSQPFTTTPEGLAKFQAGESRKWGTVVKAAGIEPE